MRYAIERLRTDVMARLGEIARPQSQSSASSSAVDVPWPEDIIGLKVSSLLPEVGSRLIRESPLPLPDCGASSPEIYRMRQMPCGLYAAEVRLPVTFIRLESAMLSGWSIDVRSAVMPSSPEWSRQWSAEAGIAGCPVRPMAYFDSDSGGPLLRLVGSEMEAAGLEWLNVWTVPEADSSGGFDFPEVLYAELVGELCGNYKQKFGG